MHKPGLQCLNVEEPGMPLLIHKQCACGVKSVWQTAHAILYRGVRNVCQTAHAILYRGVRSVCGKLHMLYCTGE